MVYLNLTYLYRVYERRVRIGVFLNSRPQPKLQSRVIQRWNDNFVSFQNLNLLWGHKITVPSPHYTNLKPHWEYKKKQMRTLRSYTLYCVGIWYFWNVLGPKRFYVEKMGKNIFNPIGMHPSETYGSNVEK